MKQDIRTGVFICRCGGDITGAVAMERVVQTIATVPTVALVRVLPYACSKTGVEEIKQDISKKKLNRLVVAGCTPRTLRPLFARLCEDAGLNRNYFEMVNLREGCARVHRGKKKEATRKAISLIRMGVAKAALNIPFSHISNEIDKSVVVIGGGITGMISAQSVADSGIAVTLIEREKLLGGLLNEVNAIYPSYESTSSFLASLLNDIKNNNGIDISTNVQIERIEGSPGTRTVHLRDDSGTRKLSAGAIIVATGSDTYIPHGLFGYGEHEHVVTQIELEELLKKPHFKSDDVVMIQCVGSRVKERPYCSRICCTAAIKNAIILKERNPDSRIAILLRGVAEYVGDIERAREKGVKFIRYSLDRLPVVQAGKVQACDDISHEELQLPYEWLVLATPLIPAAGNAEMAKSLHLCTDQFGFLIEPHLKLRRENFAASGVFVAGTAHFPASIKECIAQAHSAAARAVAFIGSGSVIREPLVVDMSDGLCRGCGTCEKVCEFGAIRVSPCEDGLKRAQVDRVSCKGCGTCAVACPNGALQVSHFTDHQLYALIEEAVG